MMRTVSRINRLAQTAGSSSTRSINRTLFSNLSTSQCINISPPAMAPLNDETLELNLVTSSIAGSAILSLGLFSENHANENFDPAPTLENKQSASEATREVKHAPAKRFKRNGENISGLTLDERLAKARPIEELHETLNRPSGISLRS